MRSGNEHVLEHQTLFFFCFFLIHLFFYCICIPILSHIHTHINQFMFSENVFCVKFDCVILLNGSKYIFDSQTKSSKITSEVLDLMKVLAPYCHISFIRLKLTHFRMTEILSDHCNSKK